jgi:carotenoid cleavage dioxygenase-like enzyme
MVGPSNLALVSDMEANYAAFHGHVAGCYENEEGHIIFDLTIASDNVFFFFPPDNPSGEASPATLQARNKLVSPTYRWIFDPKTPTGTHVQPHRVERDLNGEFSRIDDRLVTKPYNHFWQCQIDPSKPFDFQKCGPPAGGLFNVLGHFTWDKSNPVRDTYFAGPTCTFQEPVFVPKAGSTKEGEGYLIALLNHLDVLRNDILIFDALNLAQGPIAAVQLPVKLRLGLHGNWVDQSEIEEWQRRREADPVKPATEPLLWQLEAMNGSNGANGANGIAH